MKFKKIFLGLFTISAVVCLASCKTDKKDDPNKDKPVEVTEYTVTFDSRGGSSVDSQTINRGSKVTEPSAPTRDDYIFKGWYKDSGCNYSWEFDEDVVTGNVTLYAKWEEKTIYTLTFNSNGGSSVESQRIEPNQKATRPVPTKEGYIFAGWYTEENFQNEFDFNNTVITKNYTFYAKWVERSTDPEKVKVIFNSKGGSLVAEALITKGEKVEKPANPTRQGYTFVGWYLDPTDPTAKEFDFNTSITEGIALFAKWEINEYTISFDSKGGSDVSSQVVKAFEKATRPEPTRDGYIFAGWYRTEAFVHEFDFNNTEILESFTLYAKWVERSTDPEKVKVIFNTKDGSLVPEALVTKGEKVEKPADPTRNGYTFVGWYLDPNDPTAKKFDFNTPITAGITIYAKWEINIYRVSFESMGGSAVNPQDVEAFKLASRPEPTRDGYIFAGWYKENTHQNEFDFKNTQITGNITLYAKWTKRSEDPNKVKVVFNSKDGSFVPDALVTVGEKVQKPDDPTREGYRFVGWFKETGGNLRVEFDFNTVITEGIALFAVWELSEYKVTFSGTSLKEQIVPVGGKVTKPSPDPVKANHTFAGWFEDAEFTKPWNFDVVLNYSESAVTIYAKFEEKTATDEDKDIKFPFNDFHNMAKNNLNTESKTDKELSISQFVVEAGVKTEAAILNTQGKSVTFTVNGTISNGFVLTGSGASSNKTVTVTLLQGDTVLGTWEVKYQATKTITVEGLDKGTYTIKTSGSIRTTAFTLKEINVPVEVVVHFDTKNGSLVPDALVNKWGKLTAPTAPTKDGYTFVAWYTDSALNNEYDFNSKVLEEMTLYAKWEEKPVDPNLPIYTISYNPQGGSDIPDKKVNEGEKVAAPEDPIREGYIFRGWYEEADYINKHDFTQPVTQNYTLHAKWEEKPLIISFVGADLTDLKAYRNTTIEEPAHPQKPNYIFAGWYADQAFTKEFDFSAPLTKDTTIYIKWEKDPEASDYVEGGQGTVGQKGTVEILEANGLSEAAYITFKKVTGASGYSISLKNSSGAVRVLDDNSVYIREVNGNMRADISGVVPGSYEATVLPLNTSNANPSTATFNVGAYDRSGYAHFNYTDGVGAYNDDGSLKKNAIVLYVTDANKNTISITHKGVTVTGIGNILNSVGEDVGGGLTSKGGKANSNQGILKLLAEDNIPLVVRFVGCVSNTGIGKQGSFAASSTPKIDGLTIYNSLDWGGTVGDNGHMARMKSGKNITLEGVGEDAVIDGWGFHFMAESSAPDFGKNFEVRNLTFINTPEDAVGMEGVQSTESVSATIIASVERCWVHNCEFYCPNITSPAESDKAQGDGSVDFKRGQYYTCSYNYFEDCHKTHLVGSGKLSLQFNVTFHHNYYKNCESRGPLARNANIHMYNNVFEGQSSYAMQARANSYIFSEYNLFYCCKTPQSGYNGEGPVGYVKSFNDSYSSCDLTYDSKETPPTIVTDKNTPVSNGCKYEAAGIDYSKFELDPKLSYIPSGDYVLQTNITEARRAVTARCGVVKDHSIAMQDVTMEQMSYLPKGISPKIITITDTPVTEAPGKISKTVYAFTIDSPAIVTADYSTDDGVLVNLAGECFMFGNGSVILTSGTYMIQSNNFNPAKDGNPVSFKDLTINSLKFEKYNSEELNQQIIAEFEATVAKIPANITYIDSCLSAINTAKASYNSLSPELKTRVSASYAKVQSAYQEYLAKGVTYVEGLISAIGTVDANSGAAISLARSEYTKLHNTDSSVQVSNLSTLTAAEAAFATYAIDSCIAKIEAIGTVTIDSGAAITVARNEYNALSASDKEKITNRQKLFDAEEKYSNLLALAEINTLIAEADLTDLASCEEVINAFNELTNEQKGMIEDTVKLSNIFVARVDLLIAAIPSTITIADSDAIYAAEEAYNSLTLDDKAKVADYSKLQNALQELDAIGEARLLVSSITADNFAVEGDATKVSVNHPLVYTSKFKIKNPTKILLSVSVGDKGTSGYKVSYSTDKTNWTEISSEQGFSSKQMDFTIEPTAAINGEVYIKIECICTKADKSAKTYDITKLEIYGYGSLKFDQ